MYLQNPNCKFDDSISHWELMGKKSKIYNNKYAYIMTQINLS